MINGRSVTISTKPWQTMADTFQHLDDLVKKAIERQAAKDHAVINELLGNWVSELEPVVVRQRSSIWTEDGTIIQSGTEQIIGLTAEGHDKIVVRRQP